MPMTQSKSVAGAAIVAPMLIFQIGGLVIAAPAEVILV